MAVVVAVVAALPNTPVVVSLLPSQCSSTVHTVLKQLDDELDVLEPKLEELEEDDVRMEEELLKVEEDDELDNNFEDGVEDEDEEEDIMTLDEELSALLDEEMMLLKDELLMLEETLLLLQMSTLVQTSICLQPVVVVAAVVKALPNFVPCVVVVPLPSVLVSSLQSSFMMHTSWIQLEEELNLLENIDELELDSGELEEDDVRRREELDLSTEGDVKEEEEEESVGDDEEELEEDDILTLEEDESGEDNEDRVKDNGELVDEVELWALEEELSALLSDEEEHEA